ncbi:MAG: FAD:protein FMN transferase [Pseudomonadota bacterium]|nr:FAD:protein FMN transferase [Pseudomonadota bacterium]
MKQLTGHPIEEHFDVVTQFTAMASPCVVLTDTDDKTLGAEVGQIVKSEALRIEAKFSRYQPSVVTSINDRAGEEIEVDVETANLIDYSEQCYFLSDGRFDITSGALRRVWKFDGSGTIPTEVQVLKALEHVGWQRVNWKRPILRLGVGMEIDFGGIGKEYAVDRALALAQKRTSAPVLVNLGGDLVVSGPRRDGGNWRVAIEDVDRSGASAAMLGLSRGALATSGDTYRHLIKDGIRYGHVLDPKTGWPIADAPRSVTVHAETCTEAGQLAKLALLRGADAESFLKAEQVRGWCVR